MNDALAGMIPYDSIGLYEQPKPRFFFKMPRVVPEQKTKFESDELFRRLSRESEVSNRDQTVGAGSLACVNGKRAPSDQDWQNFDSKAN